MSKVREIGFTQVTVRAWMVQHLEHRAKVTGDVDWVSLCEAAACSFGRDYDDGPLDDHGPWIWDLGIEVAEHSAERRAENFL